jgi:type IV secretion system protein VirB11
MDQEHGIWHTAPLQDFEARPGCDDPIQHDAPDADVAETLSAEPIAYDASVRHFLRPFQPWMTDPLVTEICVNAPKVVFIERDSLWQRFDLPDLTGAAMTSLATAVATASQQEISARRPLLSASLPDGSRMQFLVPPAVSMGHSFTMRKPSRMIRTLEDYASSGVFSRIRPAQTTRTPLQQQLLDLKASGNFVEFFRLAVQSKQNIVVGGKTGSGKTTFMKTLVAQIPPMERLITIENVRELFLHQENRVHLLYSQGGQGIAHVTPRELLVSCLRMRPDRILLAELTGDECEEFIQVAASGHPGSITSLHSVTPALGFERMVGMLRSRAGGQSESPAEAMRRVRQAIDIFVQFQREDSGDRYISEVYYSPQILPSAG